VEIEVPAEHRDAVHVVPGELLRQRPVHRVRPEANEGRPGSIPLRSNPTTPTAGVLATLKTWATPVVIPDCRVASGTSPVTPRCPLVCSSRCR